MNTAEDAAIFKEMSACEERTRKPVHECIKDVVKALNLGRDLRGIAARVNHIIAPSNPQWN